MVLEGLGNILKKSVDKISSAIFVDKALVDSIAKDLQRALIMADVNLSLVKEISDKIKKEGEKYAKGIEKKEHLIKLLNDEIINILGGEKKELSLGKKEKIMFVGLYGTGKCVDGESKIQLGNGEIPEIKNLYKKYEETEEEEELKEGAIINISNKNILLPSFNPYTGKIENKKATHIWKLRKKNLFEIFLDNGNDYSIKVTPEHPFFTIRNGIITKVKADELNQEDYIAIPREIEINGSNPNLFDDLKKLDLYVYLNPEESSKIIKDQNKTIKEIHKKLNQQINYCGLTSKMKRGILPIELIKNKPNMLKIKGRNDTKIITFPLFINSEITEFLGYVLGDGNMGKRYLQISNEDQEIIERISFLSKQLFNITPSIKKDKRTNKMYDIRIVSGTLVKCLGIFGLKPGKKGKNLSIPNQILTSNKDAIISFIRAYFDCDSYPSKNRDIELTSESKILIQQMNILLQRLGISSTISKKTINEIFYWRLSIKSRNAEKYAEKIGYIIKRKRDKVENYKNIGIIQGCGGQDMIPIGKLLKEIRVQLGFSIGEIQTNAVYSYGIYEKKGLISREKLFKLFTYYKLKKNGLFLDLFRDIKNGINLKNKYTNSFLNGTLPYLKDSEMIDKVEENVMLTQKSKQYLQSLNQINSEELINHLEILAISNVSWIPIKDIKEIKNDKEYVYDLTVEDNHSFIANGFIVHNTTTIAKLGAYYKKRGRSVAILGLDVHRPAASEQLEQLGKKIDVPVFIDKEMKNPISIWEKYENKLEKYNLILVDTAGRDALEESLIKEIQLLSKKINPTHAILVIAADIGQAAKTQAQKFKESAKVDGVIITRMDSSAKAGGALTACHEVNAPVYFIGTGEHVGDIEPFNPKSFVSRLLGMGDLESLLEKVRSITDEKSQKKTLKNLEEGKFTLNDFYEQLKGMQSIGSLSKIKELIPGFGKVKIPDEMLSGQEEKLKKWKHAIDSMTEEERENPEIFEKQTPRLSRIAKGSGTTTGEIRQLLKQYKMIKDLAKGAGSLGDISDPSQMSQKDMMKLAKKFGKKKFKFK